MAVVFESESWEQTDPSCVQAYIVSAFLLVGLLSVAWRQVPLTPDGLGLHRLVRHAP